MRHGVIILFLSKQASMMFGNIMNHRTRRRFDVPYQQGKCLRLFFFLIAKDHFTSNLWNLVWRLMQTVIAILYFVCIKQFKKRRGLLTKKPILLHDNARPHSAVVTVGLLKTLKWKVLLHPVYSPDLSPCDFKIFGRLKKDLEAKWHNSNKEVQNAVLRWTKHIGPQIWKDGVEELVSWWKKCVEWKRDYIEN